MTKTFCDRCKTQTNVWVPDYPEKAKGAYYASGYRTHLLIKANDHTQDECILDLCERCLKNLMDAWRRIVKETE